MATIAPVDAEAHVEWAGFLGEMPAFATTDGGVLLVEGRARRVSAHDGLAAVAQPADRASLVTAGEDGALVRILPDGSLQPVRAGQGKWPTALACGPAGAIAVAFGKSGLTLTAKGEEPFVCERTVEAVAFAPKGMRIALARYNGVELRWIGTQGAAQVLEWKGAHLGVMFSPDGRYVVTAMQENALHGWRIADSRHMRMTGYPAKVKSLSWSARGRWLASSGAPAAIVWPFSGKDGPMGKAPKELGAMGGVLATCVACHPAQDILAIGYQNGMILAVRIEDGKEISLRRGGEGAITALGWDAQGARLAFGTQSGEAGIVDVSA